MMSGFFKGLLDILYPPGLVCCSCGQEAIVGEGGFCSECELGLEPFVDAPILKCVDGYTAAVYYNKASEGAVWNLKYNRNRYVAEYLAKLVTIPSEWIFDCVIPVPLHKRRRNERGFNQSELIARYVCRRYGLTMRTDLLARIINTGSQARLSRTSRLKNLKGAFAASSKCEGLSVLLIDDVRTTGGTLTECASTLKAAGCKRIFAVTVCFAKPKQ